MATGVSELNCDVAQHETISESSARATQPADVHSTSFEAALNWDDNETTWPRQPGHSCSDFAVNTTGRP